MRWRGRLIQPPSADIGGCAESDKSTAPPFSATATATATTSSVATFLGSYSPTEGRFRADIQWRSVSEERRRSVSEVVPVNSVGKVALGGQRQEPCYTG